MPLPATPFYYGPLLAWDPVTRAAVASAGVQFFAEGDTAFATPLEVWDHTGTSLGTTLTSTSTGHVAPYVLAVATAVARSGTWSTPVYAFKELLTAAEAAQAAAEAAAASAASAGGGGSGISGAPDEWPLTFPPSTHSHGTGDLRRPDGANLAAAIVSLLGALDAQQARSAIGAGTGNGTSNLTLGATSDTAAPGNHLHSYYTTEERVLELIAANGGGGGGGSTVSVWYANGAWPALASSYPDGTTIMAIGPTDPGYTTPTGVVGIVYIPRDV